MHDKANRLRINIVVVVWGLASNRRPLRTRNYIRMIAAKTSWGEMEPITVWLFRFCGGGKVLLSLPNRISLIFRGKKLCSYGLIGLISPLRPEIS